MFENDMFYIKCLEKEPKRNNFIKKLLFNFTRPIAKITDFFNLDKRYEVKLRRNFIAEMNKKDFIETVSKNIADMVIAKDSTLPKLEVIAQSIIKANMIFNEKKRNNGFDDLNIMRY